MAGKEAEPLLAGRTPGLNPEKLLGVGAVTALVYSLVCGGAYGTESLASTIPPLYALILIVVIPVLWGLPIAMITTELATAIPSDGGYLVWIREAWGDFLAFVDVSALLVGVLVVDLSLYVSIFVAYIETLLDAELSFGYKYLVAFIFVATSLAINLIGLKGVEAVVKVVMVLSTLPFLVFFGSTFFADSFEPSRALSTDSLGTDGDVSLFLGLLLWSSSGWDYVGFMVGGIRRPKRTLPIAVILVLIAQILTYLLPVFTTVTTYPFIATLEEGGYPLVAEHLGVGSWLETVITFGGLASCVAVYNSYLFASSQALRAMSLLGVIPRIFSTFRNRQAPVAGILFFSATTMLLVMFDFEALLEVEIFLESIHLCILLSSFMRLRYKQPALDRPFSLPRNFFGAYVIPAVPMAIALAFMVVTAVQKWIHAVVAVAIVGAAVGWYVLKRCLFPPQTRRITLDATPMESAG